MEKLSVVIIAKNEEKNISRCLNAVQWADEIVVVDSGSTDNTINICKNFGVKLIQTEWQGFGKTKAFAFSKAKYDWILSIDADEVISEELKKNIKSALNSNDKKDGYKIRFELFYLDKKVRFSGLRNEYHLRLFNRQNGGITHTSIHEGINVSGAVGVLNSPIYHYSNPQISVHLEKLKKYSMLAAKKKFESNKKVSLTGVVLRSAFSFIRNYILLGGFLDGKTGFILTVNSAIYTYYSYLLLWELNYRQKKNE